MVLQLMDNKEIQVQTAEETTAPFAKLAIKTVIPSRSLIVVPVTTVLPPCESKTHFDFTPIQENTHLGPICIVYPLDYVSIRGATKKASSVNKFGLSRTKIATRSCSRPFPKSTIQEIIITQEGIFGVNMEESWEPEEIEEEVLRGDKKGFITSPADIDPREPIKLRDVEVTPQHTEVFKDLC